MNRIKIIFIVSILTLFCANVFAQSFDAYKAYLKGLLEQRSGNLKAARKDYELGIKDDPNAFAIYKDLLYLYWQLGQKAEALETAQVLDKLDGENPKTTAFLGNFYLVADSTQTAQNFWTKTLQMDSTNEVALSALASQYLLNNDLPQSATYWKRFLEQDPESIAGYLQLGLVYERQGENQQAIKTYDELIKLKPEIGEAYLAKARVYETLKDYTKAQSEYKKLLELFPQNPYVLIYMGRCYYLMDQTEPALQTLLEAQKVAPTDLNAAYWLGAVYERMGNIEKAIEEFEFIDKREKNFIVIAKLGYFYMLVRKYDPASKYFLQALKIDPTNDEVRFFLGFTYLDDKKYDKAITCFEEIAQKNPNIADVYFFLGVAYDKKKDFEQAETNLKKSLEMDPENPRTLNYLGNFYLTQERDLAQAKTLLESAVMKAPQNGVFLDSLGVLYYKMAINPSSPRGERTMRLEEAVKFLLAGVNYTRDPLGYEHLGDAYVALKNYPEGWVAYWLANEGGDTAAKKKLEQTQENMTDDELFSKMLFASQTQFIRQSILQAGFIVSAQKFIFKKQTYLLFNYVSGEGISLEFPADIILSQAKIFLKDGETIFRPRAVENEIDPSLLNLLNFASQIFSGGFYNKFYNAKTQREGDNVLYIAEGMTLVLSAKDSNVKEIRSDDINIYILSELKFANSRLPAKIKITSKKLDFTVYLQTEKYNFATEHIVIPKE
ncbi:MAG: tetratricopeptide repeat protein [Elusimicrobiota bacterium]|jgi:tetratricopeptide (TPR) repeat protein|nr:tetratricopeptide repeat protein [Elusimicrobiota bacterium]